MPTRNLKVFHKEVKEVTSGILSPNAQYKTTYFLVIPQESGNYFLENLHWEHARTFWADSHQVKKLFHGPIMDI